VSVAQAITYGINYDVVKTDTSLNSSCQTDSNANVSQQFVMARYFNANMRRAVRAELHNMRGSGFETIRSIVQLYPGAHPSGDLMNSLNLDDSVLASMGDYARDVRDAGFRELILAFGVQGSAKPTCRKSEWGDCFDAATIPATVEAEAKVIRAVQSVKGISLRVDLLNEACVSKYGPPIANANFAQFIQAAVKMHRTDFPNIPATVSCQLERSGDGLAATQQLFATGGDRIGFFDIHAYPGAANREPQILQQAAESLAKSNVPIIFGETTYADPNYRQLIVHAYRAAFHRDPQELLFWPLRSMSSHCNFDVPHPYRLKDAIGPEAGNQRD
jgi:hypothetical protein